MADYRRARDEGRLRIFPKFSSRFLSTRRDLIVYLPPKYGTENLRYPVLYMQDGQNLFDPATGFAGQEWRADIIADELADGGEIQAPIIVGIYNTGVRRMSEYAPTRDTHHRKGGKADRYAQMVAREIKPFIDHEYKTMKPAQYTAIGGSSLGGLVSLVAALEYPRVFGKAAVISPSVWWDQRAILRWVEEFKAPPRPSLWVDIGTAEGGGALQVVADTRALKDALIQKGWQEGLSLQYREFEGADHSERAWSARFGDILRFLFPRKA